MTYTFTRSLNVKNEDGVDVNYSPQLEKLIQGFGRLENILDGITIPEGYDDSEVKQILSDIKDETIKAKVNIEELKDLNSNNATLLKGSIEEAKNVFNTQVGKLLKINEDNLTVLEDQVVEELKTTNARLSALSALVKKEIDEIEAEIVSWRAEQGSKIDKLIKATATQNVLPASETFNRNQGDIEIIIPAGYHKLDVDYVTSSDNEAEQDIIHDDGSKVVVLPTNSGIHVDGGIKASYPQATITFPANVNGKGADSQNWVVKAYYAGVTDAPMIIKNVVPPIFIGSPSEPTITDMRARLTEN